MKETQYAKLIYDAFRYQVAKQIGAMAAVLRGKIDAIVLTGGIANDQELVRDLTEMIGFPAPVEVRAGEFEMEAPASGALRVLRGEEQPQVYDGVPVFSDFEYLKRNILPAGRNKEEQYERTKKLSWPVPASWVLPGAGICAGGLRDLRVRPL